MKKLIKLFAVVACLFSGMNAFSQVVVSGQKLKKPIEYSSIEDMKKDIKTLKKAMVGDGFFKQLLKESSGVSSNAFSYIEITIPVNSSLRNEESLKSIFDDVFNDMKWDDWRKAQLFTPYSYSPYKITLDDVIKSFEKDIYIKITMSDNYYALMDTNLPSPREAGPDIMRQRIAEQRLKEQQIKNEKELNSAQGYGSILNVERDEIIAEINALKSDYEEKLKNKAETANRKKATEYETKKEWAYALFYYWQDGDIVNEYEEARRKILTSHNIDAYSGYGYAKINLSETSKYKELSELIKSGNPGRGTFNDFSLHDEWKNLLMNAEKFGTEYGKYTFLVGDLTKGELNYSTKTATYSCEINIRNSDAYEAVIETIQAGYEKAWKEDWNDMPEPKNWPEFSVAGLNSSSNYVNGVAVYRSTIFNDYHYKGFKGYSDLALGAGIYNAFACDEAGNVHAKVSDVDKGLAVVYGNSNIYFCMTLYDLKLNIIDENGKELVKAKRVLLQDHLIVSGSSKKASNKVRFEGITSDVMDKIDSGKAKINLVAVYLQYGTYNKNEDKFSTTGEIRSFIKNFQEIQIPREKLSAFRQQKVYNESRYEYEIVETEM